jgi:hypothetical protein
VSAKAARIARFNLSLLIIIPLLQVPLLVSAHNDHKSEGTFPGISKC